jgi:hypothetical protein
LLWIVIWLDQLFFLKAGRATDMCGRKKIFAQIEIRKTRFDCN